MTAFDPKTLARQVIAERSLTASRITNEDGELLFTPPTVGDSTYIVNTARALSPGDRRELLQTGRYYGQQNMQVAYHALYVEPSRFPRSDHEALRAATILALLIANELGVAV